MNLRYTYILATFCLSVMLFFSGCVPPSNEVITDINLSISDPIYQKLYDHQDRQEVDSILEYFNHANPAYRLAAVNAFASIQGNAGLDSLVEKLHDPILEVRTAAAYALGQMGIKESVDPLMNAFINKDTVDVDNKFNATILEAVGKTGNKSLLNAIASVESYRKTDTLLLLGQARAIYRFALRDITSQKGTDRMVNVVHDTAYPTEVRVLAASYLSRAKEIDISKSKFRVAEAMTDSEDERIRMGCALALRNQSDEELLKILQSQLIVEKDYRVKVNILRALGNFNYIDNIDLIIDHLEDKNIHVANTAAQYLIDNGNRADAEIYKSFASKDIAHSVRAKIYASVLKHLPAYYTNSKTRIRKEVIERIKSLEGRPYDQASYIQALGYDPYNYSYIPEVAFGSEDAIVRTAGIEAISRILSSDSFSQTFKSRSTFVKREILEILKTQITTNDPAQVAVGAGIIANESNNYKDIIKNDSFLIVAADKLSLPKEIESYNEVKKALAYLNSVEYKPGKVSFNNPIDWKKLNSVTDSTIAVVKTEKGNFTVKLFGKQSPGSVANFIKLSEDDFYDGKVYHRVVPNFVIQTGCPRGDGYGSLDYTIRSEFYQSYYDDEGYVGMASAGPHTEGTQWFVTHSPTPHLDGKYTIFGKVTDGMEVIHSITPGDKIIDVIITTIR